MKKTALLVLVFILSLSGCGVSNPLSQSKIIGGTAVAPNSKVAQPMVMLFKTGEATPYCSGVLISSTEILTAAHCIKDHENRIEIGFGVNAEGALRAAVKSAVFHKDFSEFSLNSATSTDPVNDIGKIVLAQAAPQNMRAVDRVAANTKFNDGDEFTLAGYGRSNAVTRKGSGVLRSVKVPLDRVNSERKEFQFDANDKGACVGDSGGPAFINQNGRLVLAGIISRGGSADCDEETICTDLRNFDRWLPSTSL